LALFKKKAVQISDELLTDRYKKPRASVGRKYYTSQAAMG
jgi:hypothetical protein